MFYFLSQNNWHIDIVLLSHTTIQAKQIIQYQINNNTEIVTVTYLKHLKVDKKVPLLSIRHRTVKCTREWN